MRVKKQIILDLSQLSGSGDRDKKGVNTHLPAVTASRRCTLGWGSRILFIWLLSFGSCHISVNFFFLDIQY